MPLISFDAWVKKTLRNEERIVKFICISLSETIVLRTPVDTGRARANWQPSINVPMNTELNAFDKTGAGTVQKVRGMVGNALGNVFYLTNNLSYITALEYGSSAQAPSGMVRTSVAEFDLKIDSIINSLT